MSNLLENLDSPRKVQKRVGSFQFQAKLEGNTLLILNTQVNSGKTFDAMYADDTLSPYIKKQVHNITQLYENIQKGIYNPECFVVTQNNCQIVLKNKDVSNQGIQSTIILQTYQNQNDRVHKLVNNFQKMRKQLEQNVLNRTSRIQQLSKSRSDIQICSPVNFNRGISMILPRQNQQSRISDQSANLFSFEQTIKLLKKQNSALKQKIQQLCIKLQLSMNNQVQLKNQLQVKAQEFQKSYEKMLQSQSQHQSNLSDQQNKLQTQKKIPQISIIKIELNKLNQFFFIKQGNRVEVNNKNGEWYQIVSKSPIKFPNRQYYKLKIQSSIKCMIMIGVVSEDGANLQRSWDSQHSIKYFAYNGNIFENGKNKKGGKEIYQGQIVEVEIDYMAKMIYWYSNEKLLSSTSIYVSIDMLVDGDKIQLLDE